MKLGLVKRHKNKQTEDIVLKSLISEHMVWWEHLRVAVNEKDMDKQETTWQLISIITMHTTVFPAASHRYRMEYGTWENNHNNILSFLQQALQFLAFYIKSLNPHKSILKAIMITQA